MMTYCIVYADKYARMSTIFGPWMGKVRTAGALCLQLLVPFVSIILLVENKRIGRALVLSI